MRIEHKYIRNRRFRCKAWNRIRRQSCPFETITPWCWLGVITYTYEEQVKNHFEWIEKQARAIDRGTRKHWNHASASFRRELNKQRKAKERSALARINNGNYELELPTFKRDADWLYF
jgi:hypothetical protein